MIVLRPASDADAEFVFSVLRASMRSYRDHVFLARIFLLPEAQGRGIGTGLIRTICDSAHRRGLPVSLTTLKVNPVRHLYERLGFTVVGETETQYRMEARP